MPPRHSLPAEVASFIGREHEVAEIGRVLHHGRLLTLTGVGGSGKTRLALRVAAGVAPDFPDGVWLVSLASLSTASALPRAVASVLGVRGMSGSRLITALTVALASRRLLLVLDNCEHLIEASAGMVETLLSACADIRILATSREPLRVGGENVYRVPPLGLPPPAGDYTLDSLRGGEAVALFLDRARARQPSFTLTEQNAPAVAAICRRLDGLPLAIELAAAQLDVLTVEHIADRLGDTLQLLSGGARTVIRQETLRAALDWSHTLLGPTERVLFRRLSVFSGGFDVEAVEHTCTGGDVERQEVYTLLVALTRKSLVETLPAGPVVRFRLLEPVRQYTRHHLDAVGESDALKRQHAQYFTGLAEAMEPEVKSAHRAAAMARLATDGENIRAALQWSLDASAVADIEIGLRLAGALLFFWHLRGEISEGYEWVDGLIERGGGAGPLARSRALYAAAELGWLVGRADLARTRAEEAVALFRDLGDMHRLAYTLQSLPMTNDNPHSRESMAESLRLFRQVGDAWGTALALFAVDLFAATSDPIAAAQARAQLEEALPIWREIGDDWATAQLLNILGDIERSVGDDAAAAARYEEAITLLWQLGMDGTVPSLQHNLGYLALRRGDTRLALRLFREALALFRDQGDQRGMADCLTGVACALTARGQHLEAARLLGTAEALRESIGASIWPSNREEYDRAVASIRARLGKGDMEAAFSVGRIAPTSAAVAGVVADMRDAPASIAPGPLDLTEREREVAVLVAQGLTNRQIGARLFITEGTARLHVKHILQKRGFSSRAQIAAWAVEQGLTADPPAV